ncbi:MAG: hypothetical protein Q4C50_10735 [Eubacteriales bacterium]|nr:hypothetical protein [Eubacteriales bacterium]
MMRGQRTRRLCEKCIWMILLLFVFELAALSGKIQVASSYLPCGVEGQTAPIAIRKTGLSTPVADLSTETEDAELFVRVQTDGQRIQRRMVSRTCICLCGVFLLCLYRLLRQLLYRLSDSKSYRSNYTIAYIYHLAYL